MFRQDVLLRLIEQFASALARIKSRATEEPSDTREALQTLAAEYLDTTLEHLLTMPMTTLKLGRSPVEVAMAADIIALSVCQSSDDNEQYAAAHARALALYRYAFEQDTSLVNHPQRAKRVEILIANAFRPRRLMTVVDCFYLYEHIGRLDAAEDSLFDLITLQWTDVRAHGRQFYRRLHAMTDEALEQGRLPRDEVMQGADAFERAYLSTFSSVSTDR